MNSQFNGTIDTRLPTSRQGLADEQPPEATKAADCTSMESKLEKSERETENSDAEQLHDMDAVFERIGGAGRYSIFTLLVMIFAHSISGSITLSAVFTTLQLPANCSNETAGDTSSSSDNVTAAAAAMSVTSDDEWEEAVFVQTASSRFGLVCDRAVLANLPTTSYFLGYFFGCIVYGALADRVGRLRVVQASLVNMALCSIGASQAPWLWLYCLAQASMGFGDGGITAAGITYTVEFTDAKHRGIWALTVYHGCTVGIMLFTLIAYLLRDYQHQLLAAGLCAIAYSALLCSLTESPRWLASVDRHADADAALRRIDRRNNGAAGRRLPAGFSTKAMMAAAGMRPEAVTQGVTEAATAEALSLGSSSVIATTATATANAPSTGNFRQLLADPKLRLHTLLVWLIFFTVSVAFFGVALSVGRLGGNVFVNQLAAAAVEPPARLLCALVSLRLGRRPGLCVSFGLAGACLLAAGLMRQAPHLVSWRIGVAMLGKFWITMAFDLVYLYATEVFPTALRSAGVGSSSSVSRVGALISTLLPALSHVWAPLPFLLFAAGPLAVAASAPWVMVETRGRALPEAARDGKEQRAPLQMQELPIKLENGEAGERLLKPIESSKIVDAPPGGKLGA